MNQHTAEKMPQKKLPIKNAAKGALSHVLILALVSIAGHLATASLAQSAGTLGMGIYPLVGGMSITYGS
jgi:hypothetical protein